MKKALLVTSACFLLGSSAFARSMVSDTSKHDSITVRDGSSFKKAIIITDTTETAGIRAEYNWLALHYPGYTSTSQSLSMDDKNRPYDIIYIKTVDGKKKEVYFDISNYFGKW